MLVGGVLNKKKGNGLVRFSLWQKRFGEKFGVCELWFLFRLLSRVESSHRCPLLSVTLEIIHCCTFLCYWLKLLVTSILFWYLSRYYHSIRKLGFQQSNLPRRGCISSPSVISKNSTYPYSRQPFYSVTLIRTSKFEWYVVWETDTQKTFIVLKWNWIAGS